MKKAQIESTATLQEAIQHIEQTGLGFVCVLKEKKFFGLLEDSDVRRALLKGYSITSAIEDIVNTQPITVDKKWTKQSIKKLVQKKELKSILPLYGTIPIPVVDADEVIDILYVSKNGYVGCLQKGYKGNPIHRILVIGGAGYLGSVLCEKLLNKGYIVRVLDNLTYGKSGLLTHLKNERYEFIEGDIRNIPTVVDALKNVDAVIHLAAIVGDAACAYSPQETLEINYFSTRMIAEICKHYQINRFMFASTCSVYGASKNKRLLTEASETNPVSLYAEAKLQSEEAILDLADETFSPTILRMATLFGASPRMRFDLVANLFAVRSFYKSKIEIFGGDQWRPLVHVSDAADAYVKCLEAPIYNVKAQIFNIGRNEFNMQIKQFKTIFNMIDPTTHVHINTEVDDERNYYVDFSKAHGYLDYEPSISVQKGIEEMTQLFKEGMFEDYKNERYNNYTYLKGNKKERW